ncbi:hypothetical protein TRFO_17505 [Tritrichomonas foetus]|uniref:Leucine Rich Repeat family protein n=1 Tax=Tritrichomonas foetus TaxID=1144522 RepID=A0A1J4KSN2_9EUKA|nr:hypothetical protein TRFO_17505 [Tritrichomonas foetus]|eukprot:OHT12670.1 hypothetical protein TRFO_17505 [Tritrichomonas foetus]
MDQFNVLFEAILKNSINITKIAFTDYTSGRWNIFELDKIEETKVKSFVFLRDSYPIIKSFLSGAINYYPTIEEFTISNCELTNVQLGKIFLMISKLDCCKNMKTLTIKGMNNKSFPFDKFTIMMENLTDLQSLYISELDFDGSLILASLCKSQSHVKRVKIDNMAFIASINVSVLKLPPELILLNLSNNSFAQNALKSTLQLITSPSNNITPIVVQMANLKLKVSAMRIFKAFEFHDLRSNIAEFDWSGNIISYDMVNGFFSFLYTQKKMRMLILNDIKLEKQKHFFDSLSKYIIFNQLQGFDISGKFSSKIICPFLSSLKNSVFIRRIGFRCINGGDSIVKSLTDLIPTLPFLTEIIGDGNSPISLSVFYNFWEAVFNNSSICNNDIPKKDLKKLKLDPQSFDENYKQMFKALQSRPQPSKLEQRVDYIINKLSIVNSNPLLSNTQYTGDIFIESTSTPLLDTIRDQFAEVEPEPVDDHVVYEVPESKIMNSILKPSSLSDMEEDQLNNEAVVINSDKSDYRFDSTASYNEV